jgi:GntR family transcriptional regulator, transcriptional repressor for pyruvate dehydrogenase complex
MTYLATPKHGGLSLKEKFTSLIERKILSGELAIGQQLPPERELAAQTGISRTIVHAGLVELAAKKVLRIAPRKGAFVGDYRREASLELYNALIRYSGSMDEGIFHSLIEFRDIIETNTASLAASNGTAEDTAALRVLLQRERDSASVEEAVELDYELHILIAASTKNIILPMAMRSTETLYKALVGRFYALLQDREDVYALQELLIGEIERKQPKKASEAMEALLTHGKKIIEDGLGSSAP